MKNTKLNNALEKFIRAYYTHYGTICPQVLSEMMDNYSDDPSFKELFSLLSQDRKKVIDILQESLAVNQLFFKIRNDFVEDMIKNLRDINHVQEEERRLEEQYAREAAKLTDKNKKIKQLSQELALSSKQKQIMKSILDLS